MPSPFVKAAADSLTQMARLEKATKAESVARRQGADAIDRLRLRHEEFINKAKEAGSQVGKFATQHLGLLANKLTNVSGAVAGLAQGLTLGLVPLVAVHELLGSIGSMVQVANPGAMVQMTLAANNLAATMGTILTPVVIGLTKYFQQAAAVWAKLGPVVKPLFDTIGDFFAGMLTSVAPLIKAAAPFIQFFVDGLGLFIRTLGKVIAFIQGMATALLNAWAATLGITSRFNPNGQPTAAVSSVKMQSVDDMARENFQKQAQAALGGDMQTDSDYLKEIAEWAKKGQKVMEDLTGAIKDLVAWLRDKKDRVERVREGVTHGGVSAGAALGYELSRQIVG